MNQSEDGEEGEIVLSTHMTLPSVYLINLWENLYYENDIKKNVSVCILLTIQTYLYKFTVVKICPDNDGIF